MKKRLLLVLTIVMFMCAMALSADAGCAYHVFDKYQVVAPTCTTKGYTVYKCVNCEERYQNDFKDALGHDTTYEFVAVGDHYEKMLTCHRGCGMVNEPEKEYNTIVKYYSVEFINSWGFKQRDPSVGYAVLNDRSNCFNQSLYNTYVRSGSSVTYLGEKPKRVKDKAFGEYKFVGWSKGNYDIFSGTTYGGSSNENYKITISNVTKNEIFYAAWEGVDKYYDIIVYNSDGQQLLVAQHIKHGSCIAYPYSYPPLNSDVSNDYEFTGWEIGTKGTNVYEYFPIGTVHIKNVPIYAQESIRAVHEAVPRSYLVDFCDGNWNKVRPTERVAYGADMSSVIIPTPSYQDDVYVYEYSGLWETERGQTVRLSSVTVPYDSLDWNDEIYLYDEDGEYLMNGSEMVTVEDIHYLYNQNFFSSKVITRLFPVNTEGDYLLNSENEAICIEIDPTRGIFTTDVNGNRVVFTSDDAISLRNIKLRPIYDRKLKKYSFNVETVIPADEITPDDYKNGLVVQVSNENGQLVASGVTVNGVCNLYVTQQGMYNITVKSTNGKYYAEKAIVWEVFKPMTDNKENIVMNLKVDEGYTGNISTCRCLCHNKILRPLWVRVLNILYRFFGVKYVCCPDMYATIGDLLVYTQG